MGFSYPCTISGKWLNCVEGLQTSVNTHNFKKRMESGVRIDGHITKKCRVDVVGPKSFRITLTEGKKRHIRRMCAALRLDIIDLERVRIMNIKLGRLPAGARHQIVGDELKLFLKGLGL